jgi:ketosteroid isomerase-like protein
MEIQIPLRCTLSISLFLILGTCLLSAQTTTFEPLEHWRQAVLSGDAAALQSMYSTQPPVIIKGSATEAPGAGEELRFWKDRKEAGLTSLTFDDLDVKPGNDKKTTQVIFQAVLASTPAREKARVLYLRVAQSWQEQKGTWRIVQVVRGELTRLELPMHMHMMHHSLYPAEADAHAELSHALAEATRQRKRVLVVFGAGWSYDCQVLDLAFHRPDLYPLMEKHYVVLHVDTGSADKNVDLAERFQVPLEKGIPALAVLNSDGVLLFSQQNGEFKSARDLAPEDLEAFLEKWKGTP